MYFKQTKLSVEEYFFLFCYSAIPYERRPCDKKYKIAVSTTILIIQLVFIFI